MFCVNFCLAQVFEDGAFLEVRFNERVGQLNALLSNILIQGTSLNECYAAVARVADRWLDVIDTRGQAGLYLTSAACCGR